MTSPLLGFWVGETVHHLQGWSLGNSVLSEEAWIVGPGGRATSLVIDLVDRTPVWPPRETDIDIWELVHDTPAFHAWVALSSQSRWRLCQIESRDEHLAALRLATDALIADNPQLLIPRTTFEGGPPHSWAVCQQGYFIEEDAGSPARLEQVVATITDSEILDHIRRSAARDAELSEKNAPWLDDEDRVILRRIASSQW